MTKTNNKGNTMTQLTTQEIEALVDSCRPRITHLMKKYNLWEHPDHDDIFAEGVAELVKCAQDYDPTKSAFVTHSFFALRNRMLACMVEFKTVKMGQFYNNTCEQIEKRKISKKKQPPLLTEKICLDAPVNLEEGIILDHYNLIGIVEPEIYNHELPNHLEDCLDKHELALVKLLWIGKLERHGNTQAWKDEMLPHLKAVTKSESKMLTYNPSLLKIKYHIALKIYNHYRKIGYACITKPDADDNMFAAVKGKPRGSYNKEPNEQSRITETA